MSESDPRAVSITTTLHAKPGWEDALSNVLRALAQSVRREEPGCLLYQPVRSRYHAARFMLLERYRDEQSLLVHANSAHFRDALAGLMECLASPPDLAVYDEFGDAGLG
jgi:quinol monooxygenase YgiN